ALSRTIEELSSAGCDGVRLAPCLPPGPLSAAFLAVYRELERELASRGLALRAARLEQAAARIQREGAGGIRGVWLDGFHALPDPEMRVIAALGRHTDLTLTLADRDLTGGLRDRLSGLGFREERASRGRATPATLLVRASGREREVEEIARRILEQAAAGRPFREMGIIVRSAESYVPLLRATLERFGVPARFYFDDRLEEHAVTRYLCGAVDAMLGGWDHAQTLAVLRLAPRFADSRAMDEFDFAVREQIPNSGLGEMKSLLLREDVEPRAGAAQPLSEGAARLLHKIDSFEALEKWRALSLTPAEWAARLRTLRNLFRPPQFADRIPHEEALLWRSQAAVLDLFDQALEQAAMALDPRHNLDLAGFWRTVKAVLRLTPLRFPDRRRNVVQVLSAHEARQWVLPVVFVCGLVEKEFPRAHRQDAFLPDAARARLNDAGVRVRTAAEFAREEQALFDSASTRATLLVTLSYPEFDARGERNLPSIFLEGLMLRPEEARAVRPRPRHAPEAPSPPAIREPRLLEHIRRRSARLSPTRLEIFLQCPFQYFGARTLRLDTAPPLPRERLDFISQGLIVHEVLATWYADPQPIEPLFEAAFERVCEEKHVPVAYHTERLRNAMLDDLRAFAADARWQRDGFTSRMEEPFEFALDESLAITGKIDRIDTAPDGRAYVIDYKYSAAQRTRARKKDQNLLQAPLYLLAAEKVLGVKPAGMFYVGLKGGVEYVGWSDTGILDSAPLPENWLEKTAERALQAAAEIRAGRVEPRPAKPDNCRFCDFRDVCRFAPPAAEAMAEGE
ncbi:MAG TPA: PD-(D/E)XK nuclease family protein, partial [Candidatus Sulfopaludibacter sp.]|nr:PD-(D/E)XK nuclease family protein [Candidatus Sulfopaludibacter sp.]